MNGSAAAPSPSGIRSRVAAALALIGTLLLPGCSIEPAAGDPAAGSMPGGTSDGRGSASAPGTSGPAGYGELDAPVSPFDDVPAITLLSADLRDALQLAADEAAVRDIRLVVTSGWRSVEYQQRLFDGAVREYGSKEEALAWVLPPHLTSHVTGEAVDVGFTDGADWLGRFGNRWGLCQPFANEMWHFELLIEPGGTCPPQLSSSAERAA